MSLAPIPAKTLARYLPAREASPFTQQDRNRLQDALHNELHAEILRRHDRVNYVAHVQGPA